MLSKRSLKPSSYERSKESYEALWKKLHELIDAYASAAIAESWKGGGDPSDVELFEVKLKVAELELSGHISKMQKEFK